MIIGHHLIWTAYGWWLPNDPRGSMSREIRKDALIDLGDLHYGRKRIQPANWKITRFYAEAAESLQFNLLKFSADEVAEFGADTPMKRPAQPSEVAPAYVFLASQDASYINGQFIHVNGGSYMN